MNEKLWLFKDLCGGYTAFFTDIKKADEFVKAYGLKMYDLNGNFPEIDNDYILKSYEVDPDVSTVKELFD